MKKFTHFLNIPIKNFIPFNNKFSNFKKQVSEIDPLYQKYFYNNHPHLTLAILSISEDDEKKIQKIFFKNEKNVKKLINKKILKKEKKIIFDIPRRLDGFYNKNNNKKETNVIFSPIDNLEIKKNLNEINNFILQKFISKEIIKIIDFSNISYNSNNKLFENNQFHITLMKSKQSFDSTNIFKNFKKFDFGKFELDKISLKKLDKKQTEVAYINL